MSNSRILTIRAGKPRVYVRPKLFARGLPLWRTKTHILHGVLHEVVENRCKVKTLFSTTAENCPKKFWNWRI